MPAGQIRHAPWNIIRELAMNGQSLSQLAKQFGLNYGTVLSRSTREGWKIAELRAERGMCLSQDERTALAKTSQAASDALPAVGRETKLSLAIACKTAAQALAKMNASQILKHTSSLKAVADCSDRIFNWTNSQNARSGAINLALFNTDPHDLAKLAKVTNEAIGVHTAPLLDSQSSTPLEGKQ
jgi:hypothetical protein